MGKTPPLDAAISLISQVLETANKQTQVALKRLLVNGHVRELVQNQPDIQVELAVDAVGQENCLFSSISFDLNVDFVPKLVLSQPKT